MTRPAGDDSTDRGLTSIFKFALTETYRARTAKVVDNHAIDCTLLGLRKDASAST